MAIEIPEIEMVLVEGGTFTMGATPEQGDDACDDEKTGAQGDAGQLLYRQIPCHAAAVESRDGQQPERFQG